MGWGQSLRPPRPDYIFGRNLSPSRVGSVLFIAVSLVARTVPSALHVFHQYLSNDLFQGLGEVAGYESPGVCTAVLGHFLLFTKFLHKQQHAGTFFVT